MGKGINELSGVNNQVKPGCCAHGLPTGACPVCSMSGGVSRKPDRSGRPGEMSYHQCAMIGNMMKARELAQKNHEQNLKLHAQAFEQFEANMAKLIQNIKQFIQIVSQSFISKPLAIVLNITVIPLLTIIKNVPQIFQTINNLRFEIHDKLAAIYGELKAFILKKTEEGLKVLGSFFEKIFKTSKKNNAEDDDTKIDEDKKIFNLKTIIYRVREKFNKKKDKNNEYGTEN